MKISYNWLCEYYKSPLAPVEIARFLTDCGLEVEGMEEVESVKGGLKGLIVGEVITCIKHPDADKLSLTTVDTGSGENAQIVCGAPNVAVGQKVIVALPGTEIHPLNGEPFVIRQAKIRGQLSQGMICAEDEIGLGRSHEGILILDASAKNGMSAREYFHLESDTIFEIGLTPNRADAASHFGVARDLAAVVRAKSRIENKTEESPKAGLPSLPPIKVSKQKLDIEVAVEDTEACPRYSGMTMTNVKVGASPKWLKERLQSIGVKPVNNIVDVTNFVLHECGQPMHAFDANKIEGNKIVVRQAKANEKFVTLDGIERMLLPGELMICDVVKPMCIAGIFGGINSGINENTTSIFLESACFNPASIRKTSKHHALKTDASFRFERGTDPEMTLYALRRAAILIGEITGGKVSSEITDFYPVPVKPVRIALSYAFLDQFSGMRIDRKIVREIVLALGINIISEDNDNLHVQIPAYKVDVTRPADVVEEILRIYGYDRIPVPSKLHASMPGTLGVRRESTMNKVGDYLAGSGFHEILTNSLTKSSHGDLVSWKKETMVNILNPLSQDLSVMRQDLLANALETVQYNSNRKNFDLRFFEFGKTYSKKGDRYDEKNRLLLLLTGSRNEESWLEKQSDVNFYLLKAYVNNVMQLCRLDGIALGDSSSNLFSAVQALTRNGRMIVEYGEVQPAIVKKFDITAPVLIADFDWDAILEITASNTLQVSEVSKFPSVKRDLSMLIAKDISYSKLEEIAYRTEKKLLREIRLFDVYAGDKIDAGKKSYAVSFILQDEQQTLTDSQIGKVMEKLMAAFEKEAGAVIRKN